MRESLYTSDIRRKLPPDVYALKLALRHESGVADSWYSGPGRDLWVEYKWYKKLPKVIDLKAGKKPKLTRLQQEWLADREAQGRNVWVIVACPQGAVIMQSSMEWTFAWPREEFLSCCISKAEIADTIANFCSL